MGPIQRHGPVDSIIHYYKKRFSFHLITVLLPLGLIHTSSPSESDSSNHRYKFCMACSQSWTEGTGNTGKAMSLYTLPSGELCSLPHSTVAHLSSLGTAFMGFETFLFVCISHFLCLSASMSF